MTSWHVTGRQVEKIASRHRFDSEESLLAFHQSHYQARRHRRAAQGRGVEEGDTVWIGTAYELEWQD